jgi:hypothetical protein
MRTWTKCLAAAIFRVGMFIMWIMRCPGLTCPAREE